MADRFKLSTFFTLSLKRRLVMVFVLVSLIPTITLVVISNIMIAKSIDRWEEVSDELKKLRVLPMVENASVIAEDFSLLQALEEKKSLSGMDFGLPEGYIVAIYDMSGKSLFSFGDDPTLHERLSSLGELGLPPAGEFRPGEPVLPKEALKLGNKELGLSAMLCRSKEDGRALGIVVVGKVMPSVSADIGRVRKTTIAALTLTAVLVFLFAFWISSLIVREITDPIQRLVVGTREVAGGNLNYKVDVSGTHPRRGTDEVGMLADSFNQMTVKLRETMEELRRVEKAAAWKEVAQKLAHEIKNPLTPIQLSAERLQRRYYSNRQDYEQILNECTQTIIDEVGRLRRLLDEFSQFARLPAINPIPSSIQAIVHEAIKLYGELPENVEIKTQFSSDLQALVDPDQMKRAIFNIIKNAIEAMKDGGELTITTRTRSSVDSTYVEIEFADTGPGISLESMGKLFTPHFSTKPGGAGLGLAIVKKIVTDHGGDITVKSEEGKGTTFVISIPVSALTPSQPARVGF